MAQDREILREIWDGHLPVSFSMASEDVATMQQPDPYYVMVPRNSYFPLVIDKVVKNFTKHISEHQANLNDLWLDFDGQPLKWHYPIGLLWDLYGADSSLPWNITIHFTKFPEEELVRCSTRSAIETVFISTIKEADTLKHRGDVMNSMQKKDHTQLWLGLQNDRFDQFWSVNKKLMERTAGKAFMSIPLRFYQQDVCGFHQVLVKPVTKETGDERTLRDLVLELSLCPPSNTDQSLEPRLIIHGIEPPLDTPLQWLSEHLSFPDNFLHLCIHWREAQHLDSVQKESGDEIS
ncbi:Autophagy protein 5 [Halotydeus destructor]|nr:Autophagy protein 5 [Halotydeus destructor]